AMRGRLVQSMKAATSWLMGAQFEGLWQSGVLNSFTWDYLWATACVLHRLLPMAESDELWRATLDRALLAMVRRSRSPSTWLGYSEVQRYRVEARVGAAVARALRCDWLTSESRE